MRVLGFILILIPQLVLAQVVKEGTFTDASGAVTEMTISSDNLIIVGGNELGIITAWNSANGNQLFKVRPHKTEVKILKTHPTKDQIISSDGQDIVFLELNNGTEVERINMFSDIEDIQVSTTGDELYVLGMRKNVPGSEAIYGINLTTRKFEEFAKARGVSYFKVSSDDKYMYMVNGKDLIMRNIELQIDEKKFTGHIYRIRTADISWIDPDWVLTSDRSSVKFWQVSSGKHVPLSWEVNSAYIINDTKILVNTDNSVSIRDYKQLGQQSPINTTFSSVEQVELSGDRTKILVRGKGNFIELWSHNMGGSVPEELVTQTNASAKQVSREFDNATANTASAGVSTINIGAYPYEIKSENIGLYQKYQNEIDVELKLKEQLFKPRGEFEKSTDYEERQAEARSYVSGIFAYYENKEEREQAIQKQLELAKQRYLDSLVRLDEERKLKMYKEKIHDSYNEFLTSITSLGTYNADYEYFPVTVEDLTKTVVVPIDEAPEFKANYAKFKVVGARQLNEDASEYEKFNYKIVTDKGKVYDFGIQKEPVYVDNSAVGKLLEETLAPFQTRQAVELQPIATTTTLETPPSASKEPLSIEARLASRLKEKNYYALLIGVSDYDDDKINDLEQPIDDALRLKGVLKDNYTFEEENITLLRNPTREEIIESFDELAKKVTEEDNLLVFYAGHGIWDETLKQGYWLPKNARQSSKAAWLSNGTIRDYIGGIKSKHTLLVADACFSGGIFKTRDVFMGDARAVLELYKLKSRKAMTSGNMKTVPDKSVFMEYLLQRLMENENTLFTAEELFSSFRVAVINNSVNGQVPQYGDIRQTGDEGGDFVFLRRE